MAMRRERIKGNGERDLRLRFMWGTGLVHDPARLDDAQESAIGKLKCFQLLETSLRKQGLASILGPLAECQLEIYDMAVGVYAAAHDIGFMEGVARLDATSHIAAYYEKFPERRVIAKYVRRNHAAMPIEICRYIDKREEAQISSFSFGKRPRPYPLPWESKERDKRFTKRELERRLLWIDALEKNDAKRVRNLRSFLTEEIRRALCDENAQMYFAWSQVRSGKVIEADCDEGPRQVSFGDPWSHLKLIGAEIPLDLESVLRERETADHVQVGELYKWRSHRYQTTLADVLPGVESGKMGTVRVVAFYPGPAEHSCANADSAMDIPSPS
jgi:hypothetical protein